MAFRSAAGNADMMTKNAAQKIAENQFAEGKGGQKGSEPSIDIHSGSICDTR